MSTTELVCVGPSEQARSPHTGIRLTLLGLGRVGSAVVRLAAEPSEPALPPIRVASALVRDPRPRHGLEAVPITTRRESIFDARPDVVVEALGGVEPARSLVLDAIARGIPVVTANKSLLARHGDEILDAAAEARVPLRYEASVIAGVPFLGTFAHRPIASRVASLTAIVNGTTNYILSEVARGRTDYRGALAEAQRRGFAEPDPSNDVGGIDAAEKLVVLLRQFAACSVALSDLESSGITNVTPADFAHAAELGGTIKPVVQAEWTTDAVDAFSGPAFVPSSHPLAAIHGAGNGIILRDWEGREVGLTGPGAGPRATAVTILDDVRLAVAGGLTPRIERRHKRIDTPETPWFIRLGGAGHLPEGRAIADLLGSYSIGVARSTARTEGEHSQALLTFPVRRDRLEAAAAALSAAARCSISIIRALKPRS